MKLFISLAIISLLVDFSDASCSTNCRYGADYCYSTDRGCIYGCEPGYTGRECDIHCNQRCLECEWKETSAATNCTICEPGYYGTDCNQTCSENCLFGTSKCDKSGNCIYGCNLGWIGPKCDVQRCDYTDCLKCAVSYHSNQIYCLVCKTGKFWSPFLWECTPCSDFCVNGNLSCNSTTGICFHGCQPGYFGSNCDKVCSISNCSQCQETYTGGMYCADCQAGFYKSGPNCKKCSSHCIGGSLFCDEQSGKCTNGCEAGWFGDKCDQECTIPKCHTCKPDIVSTRPPVCDQCEAGYYWNERNKTCVACSTHCLGGQSMCSVTNGTCLNGCVEGRYGQQCEWLCSQYCVDGQCDSLTGHCTNGCQDGWFGVYCDRNCPTQCAFCSSYLETGQCSECTSGWYGDICEKYCSRNCKRSTYNNYLYCDKVTGACPTGCNAGYYGEVCNLTCSLHCPFSECNFYTGKCTYPCSRYRYGDYCENKCSLNCVSIPDDPKPCNEISGICVRGCSDGYYGDFCNKTCHGNCLDSKCSRVSGVCTGGCMPGYHGNYCNLTCNSFCHDNMCNQQNALCVHGCVNGMHGQNCTQQCSSNCRYSACNQTTGFCLSGCVDGYHGDTCEIPCESTCYNNTCSYDGVCTVGCISGREGDKCQDICSSGFYGRNCEERCGYCRDKTVCDPVTGTCEIGCQVGWTSHQCNKVVASDAVSQSKTADTSIVIAGSAAGAVLIVVLIPIIVVVIVRRGRHPQFCTKKRHSSTTFDTQDINMETFGFSPGTTDLNVDAIISSSKRNQYRLEMKWLQIYEEPVLLRQKQFLCEIKSGTYRNCLVTVKVYKKDEESTVDKNLKRFQREAEVLKTMDSHQNVLNFCGFCQKLGILYHVFESCHHGNLKKYLQDLSQTSTDPPVLTFLTCYSELMGKMLDILSGLMFLQENQIIHRLIAAENIFLDKDKICKIGNFYFAIKEGEDLNEDSHKMPYSYKPWMAIESRRKNIYSYKSDVWSFGVLLWEVATLGEDLSYTGAVPKEVIYPAAPDGCDRHILKVMESCWRAAPSTRPTFQELFNRIASLKYKNKVLDTEEVEFVTTMV